MLGLRCSAEEDELEFAGKTRAVCYRKLDLRIPGTDWFVEKMRVAVIATELGDIPGAILGADFLDRTGAFRDARRGRVTKRKRNSRR